MGSTKICAQCLRTLRQNLRAERIKSPASPSAARQQLRILSTRSPLLQQSQRASTPSPQESPASSVATLTVTANATAVPSSTSQNAPADLSTAEMQRQINSRLSSSPRPGLTQSLASTLSRTKTAQTYITYGVTEALFKACSAQAEYTIPEDQRTAILTGNGPLKTAGGEDLGIPAPAAEKSWWFDTSERGLGLQPTFSTWSQVSYLHMYLLTVRLRNLESPSSFQNYQRYLLEHFSHAAEDKMLILHNMGARGIRNRYLKDLFLQWRGVLAAYDEGLVSGDAVLAGAVWRNLWKGDENVDWEKVRMVVVWMRACLGKLEQTPVEGLGRAAKGEKSKSVWESARIDVIGSLGRNSEGISEAL